MLKDNKITLTVFNEKFILKSERITFMITIAFRMGNPEIAIMAYISGFASSQRFL